MQTLRPDIIVTSPDGEYLIIVEIKFNDNSNHAQSAIEQVKHIMVSTDCSVGLVITNERIILLRDSLEKYNGASIYIVGEAKIPSSLIGEKDSEFEFASRVQNWLENLKLRSNVDKLPSDLRTLLSGTVINLLQWGEVRAARPRWSKTVE
jgi:hypothetical protein